MKKKRKDLKKDSKKEFIRNQNSYLDLLKIQNYFINLNNQFFHTMFSF